MFSWIRNIFTKGNIVYAAIFGFLLVLLTFNWAHKKYDSYVTERAARAAAAADAQAQQQILETQQQVEAEKIKKEAELRRKKIEENIAKKRAGIINNPKELDKITKPILDIKVKGGGSIRKIE